MSRWSALAALGALFLFGILPFEAKSACATLVTGVSLLGGPVDGAGVCHHHLLPLRRPARLARSAWKAPAPVLPAQAAAPLPAAPRLQPSRPAPSGLFAEAARRTRQRGERAPPGPSV